MQLTPTRTTRDQQPSVVGMAENGAVQNELTPRQIVDVRYERIKRDGTVLQIHLVIVCRQVLPVRARQAGRPCPRMPVGSLELWMAPTCIWSDVDPAAYARGPTLVHDEQHVDPGDRLPLQTWRRDPELAFVQ